MSLLRKYCTVHYLYSVNTLQYITVVHYLLPKYCTVHYSGTLCHYYVNTVQYIIYCTVRCSGTLCHYYINTVQYITYSVNTVQYITVVHYFLCKLRRSSWMLSLAADAKCLNCTTFLVTTRGGGKSEMCCRKLSIYYVFLYLEEP